MCNIMIKLRYKGITTDSDQINSSRDFCIMSSESSIPWFDDFVGVAYRYYDLRMNVVPLFTDRKQSTSLFGRYNSLVGGSIN